MLPTDKKIADGVRKQNKFQNLTKKTNYNSLLNCDRIAAIKININPQ
jgi:hypothetical protein